MLLLGKNIVAKRGHIRVYVYSALLINFFSLLLK